MHIGKRASEPKHGKKDENRLWSKYRRGDGVKTEEGGGRINPDGAIEIAAVCGAELRTYAKVKHGRHLMNVRQFAHHGAAVLYATEFEESQR